MDARQRTGIMRVTSPQSDLPGSRAEVFVEEGGDFTESFFGFGSLIVEHVLSVRLAFEDLQLGIDARLAEFAVDANGVAQEQVAGAGGENGRRESVHVAVDRGDERVGQIVAVRIEYGGGVTRAIGGDENVVDHCIGVERVAGLGRIRHGCAGRNGSGHGQAFLLGAKHHLKRECTASGGPEDREVPGIGGLEGRFVHSHGIVERAGEVGLGWHTVVDGDDLEVTEAGHDDGFRCSSLTWIEDITSAVQVNEELVLVFGSKDIGGHDKDAHAIHGVCFDGDVEAMTQGGEGLDRFGCPPIGGRSPLLGCLPEAIPLPIERSRDELLHFRADVRRDGERFAGHLQGRIVVRLRTGVGRG